MNVEIQTFSVGGPVIQKFQRTALRLTARSTRALWRFRSWSFTLPLRGRKAGGLRVMCAAEEPLPECSSINVRVQRAHILQKGPQTGVVSDFSLHCVA